MSDKDLKVAFIKLHVPKRYLRDIEAFKKKWKSNPVEQVSVVFGDQVQEFSVKEFLETLGFEVPCETCEGSGIVEIGVGDDIREEDCMDCGPHEPVEMDDDSGEQDDIQEDTTSMEEKLDDLKGL